MTTLREAAAKALEALEYGQHTLTQISENQWESRGQLAMQALRAALAEPVQEPVAWLPPDPPPECKSEAEKTAFAFGWFKALEKERLAKEEAIYETIIQWDEGGGKRSRRELARRIVALYASTGDTP